MSVPRLLPAATCGSSILRSSNPVRNCSIIEANNIQTCLRLTIRHATTSISSQGLKNGRTVELNAREGVTLPPHSLLPTPMLLRSLLITTVLSKPYLLKPALNFMLLLTKKRLAILNINKNPVLYAVLKRTFYNHFCAGENETEVTSTIRNIKDIGFKGVILTYAREIVVDERTKQERGLGLQATSEDGSSSQLAEKEKFVDVEAWRSGVLETLEMVSEGDFLALKFTGAGSVVTESLRSRQPLPRPMQDALEAICTRALERDVSILVDAEQQSVQPAIDAIALDLMSKYNRNGKAIVYNTYQMYIKSMVANLNSHMQRSAREGYTLGVKIVRGAYMNSEPRDLIHDTKENTDLAYDESVKAMLLKKYVSQNDTSSESSESAPSIDLFVATHNKSSALSALSLHQERVSQGLPTVGKIQYGQLLGMADEVSCELLQKGLEIKNDTKDSQIKVSGPEVYKCLSWGTLDDCLSYLVRRAVENKDAVTRTKSEQVATKAELWRRIKNSFRLRSNVST